MRLNVRTFDFRQNSISFTFSLHTFLRYVSSEFLLLTQSERGVLVSGTGRGFPVRDGSVCFQEVGHCEVLESFR